MAEVFWDAAAEQDLNEIWDYIGREKQSPIAADRLIDAIRQKAETYASQPDMGVSSFELAPNVRSFREGNYLAFYQPLEEGIVVLRVFHGNRDYPRLFRTGG